MFLNSSTKLLRFINRHHITYLRFLTNETNAQSLLVNVLGMNENVAQQFITEHKINNVDSNKLKDTVDFIKKQKYKVSDILKHPRIFQQHGNHTWQHYYNYFTECGCTKVPITNIINFRRIRYTAISVLKDLGVIPKDTVVVDSLLSQLDITIPEDKVCKLRNDELTLSYVHRSVTHNYLITKLGAKIEDLETIDRIHKHIYNKSLKTLCENVNLALEIGFSPGKILRNAYILQVNPDKTRAILNEIPNFLNCDMRAKMRSFPKLIGQSLETIYKIHEILKKFNISDETAAKVMNIFTLAPQTVEARLNDVKSTPETRVLMNNPHILQLIVHYHRAKSRLQFLHKVRLKCASLVVISFDGNVFDNYIKEGKDINKRSETSNFLYSLLKCTKDDLEVNFKRHPYYLYVPFVDIENTYRYLRHQQFANHHIIKAISILLYPKEKIIDVLELIREDHYLSSRKPRVNKSKILNLALYYLEKDHHFTGNGIWRVNEDYVQTLQ